MSGLKSSPSSSSSSRSVLLKTTLVSSTLGGAAKDLIIPVYSTLKVLIDATARTYPTLSPTSISLHCLFPGVGGLIEVDIDSDSDVQGLKTGDLLIVRGSDRIMPADPVTELPASSSSSSATTTEEPEAIVSPSKVSFFGSHRRIPQTSSSTTVNNTTQSVVSSYQILQNDFKQLGFEILENSTVTISSSSSTSITKSDKKTSSIPRLRLILKDFEEGGIASSVEVEASAYKLSQKQLVDKYSLSIIPHPGDAGLQQPLLATSGWETSSKLFVVVPSERMPPAVWSTHVALIAGTKQASADKLLSEIFTSTSSSDSKSGVLFLNPFVISRHTSTSSSFLSPSTELPAQAVLHAASANLKLCWDKLLATHPSKKLVFITHGEGANVLLSLLGDKERGLRAREKTKAVAFLSPNSPPRGLLVDIFGQENPTLVEMISNRSASWVAQIRPSHGLAPSTIPRNQDGTQPLEIRPVLFGPEFDAPNFEADAGCIVTNVGLSVPGTAALRDEAFVVASGYVPHFASQQVVSFLTHMQSDKVTTASEWAKEEKKAEEQKEALESKREEELREAEKEAKIIAEKEAKEKVEKEAKEKAEKEAKEKVEKEAKEKAEKETKVKADKDAKDKAERDAMAALISKKSGETTKETKEIKAVATPDKDHGASLKPTTDKPSTVSSEKKGKVDEHKEVESTLPTPTSPSQKQPAPVTKSRARMMMEASAAAVATPSSTASSPAPTPILPPEKKTDAAPGASPKPLLGSHSTSASESSKQTTTSSVPVQASSSSTTTTTTTPTAAIGPSASSTPASITLVSTSPFAGLKAPFEKTMTGGFERLKFLHASGETEWTSTGISSGVMTYVMSPNASRPADIPASEPIVGARGDSILPFPPAAIMHLLSRDEKSAYELDPTIDKKILVEEVVPDLCRLEHMKYKGVAMTDPRDFAVASGGVVDSKEAKAYLFSTSLEHEKVPKAKGFVRGRLEVGAWVLEPINSLKSYDGLAKKLGLPSYPKLPENEFLGACRVSYLFRLSIGGSLPKFLVQQISAAQAKTPSLVSKLLEGRFPITTPKGRAALKSAISALPENMATFGVAGAGADVSTTSSSHSTTTTTTSATDAPLSPSPLLSDATHSSASVSTTVATPVKDSTSHVTSAEHSHDISDKPLKQQPYPEVSFDLSGTWRVDKATSDTLEELLKEMGVPWIARKAVEGLEVTTILRQTGSSELTIEERSRLGDHSSKISLNWKQFDVKGGDGKVVKVQAIALSSIDSLEITSDAVAAVDAHLKSEANTPSTPTKKHCGPGSGCIISTSILPGNLGITYDQRHLVKPNLLRLITVYVKEGKVRAKLTRYLHRLNPETLHVLPQVEAQETHIDEKTSAVVPKPTSVSPPLSSPSASLSTHETATIVDPAGALSPASVVTPHTEKHLHGDHPSSIESPARPTQPFDSSSPRPPVVSSAAEASHQPQNVPVHPEGWNFARWIPDEKVTKCETCKLGFTGLRRLHHCRSCGLAFCGSCSPSKLPLMHFSPDARKKAGLKDKEPVRVCVPCAAPFVLSASTCGSAGGKVTLFGGNLGERGSTVQIKIASPFSKPVAIKVEPSWEKGTHTSLTFVMPPGVGKRDIYLTVDDRTLIGHFEFFYDPIELSSIELIESDGGNTILRGKNLPGTNAVDLRSLEVRINGQLCPVLRCFERYTAVEINAPPGTGGVEAGNVVSVAVTGCAGKKPAHLPFSYAPPHIFAVRLVEVKPMSLQLVDKDPIKINPCIILYGASFGETAVNISLTINGDPCEDLVLLVPHSKFRATVPKSVLTKAVSGDELIVCATVKGVKGETIKTNFV